MASERYRPKPEKELLQQVADVDSILGTHIVPESETKEDIVRMSVAEIKAKYPERYALYVDLFRKSKAGKEIEISELEEVKTWIKSLNNLDYYIIKHKELGGVLRDRQVTVFEDLRTSLEGGDKTRVCGTPYGSW